METPADYLRRMAPIQTHEGRHKFHEAADLLDWLLGGDIQTTDEVELLSIAKSALSAIRGPLDQGPWIVDYQQGGGGYQGLQAIARKALEMIDP